MTSPPVRVTESIKAISETKTSRGSVIYDLAAVQGGNTAFTEVDKIIDKNSY